MDINNGKKLYSTYSEASREAERLTQAHKQGFRAYKVGAQWAVGGVHMKERKKIKSFEDLHHLLDIYKESDDDNSIDAYINEIKNESLVSESEEVGVSPNWILQDIALKSGCDIGMSSSNRTIYLVLTLKKEFEEIQLKMGGKFGAHIPLVKKQCEGLIGKSVRWYTWNSKFKKTNWLPNEWFYLVEEDFDNE